MNVVLKPLYHRGGENIAICYPNSREINLIVRKLPGVKWSQTNKCWYLPLNKTSYKAICDALTERAAIDDSLLKQYLQKKEQVQKTVVSFSSKSQTPIPKDIGNKVQTVSPVWKLSKENLTAMQKFIEQLKLKAYSTSTIKTYRNEFYNYYSC